MFVFALGASSSKFSEPGIVPAEVQKKELKAEMTRMRLDD
jgi:hypothetical protein